MLVLELLELLGVVDEGVYFGLALLHFVLEVEGVLLDLDGHFCDHCCLFLALLTLPVHLLHLLDLGLLHLPDMVEDVVLLLP